jgi:hypothetical protein
VEAGQVLRAGLGNAGLSAQAVLSSDQAALTASRIMAVQYVGQDGDDLDGFLVRQQHARPWARPLRYAHWPPPFGVRR